MVLICVVPACETYFMGQYFITVFLLIRPNVTQFALSPEKNRLGQDMRRGLRVSLNLSMRSQQSHPVTDLEALTSFCKMG